MNLKRLSKILPNSYIGNSIDGARIVRDRNGVDIGHVAGAFYLYSGYEHGYEVYKRLLENGVYPKVVKKSCG